MTGLIICLVIVTSFSSTLACNQVPHSAPTPLPKCGSQTPQPLMIGSFYTIASPTKSNGAGYLPNQDCIWFFDVAPTCQPILACELFDVANSADCTEDFLKVFDGPQRTLRLCGKADPGKPFQFESTGSNFFDLQFVSNKAVETAGFKCTITCKNKQVQPPVPPPPPAPQPPVVPAPAPKPPVIASPSPPAPQPAAQPGKPPAKPDGCDCGRSDLGRIIGGTEARKHQYIWQVALKYDGNFLCGGSVIGPRHILTASHCTKGRDASRFSVLLGRHNLTAPFEVGSQTLGILNIISNPKTDSATLDYDFAILTLASQINVNNGTIGAVCLPKDDSDSFANTTVFATGWGTRNASFIDLPSILNQVELQTTPAKTCGQYEPGEIKESMLCAGAQDKDACQGDSGGPLVMLRNGTYTLIGVTSWGIGCATRGFPGVYARVSKVLDWIHNATNGKICSLDN